MLVFSFWGLCRENNIDALPYVCRWSLLMGLVSAHPRFARRY